MTMMVTMTMAMRLVMVRKMTQELSFVLQAGQIVIIDPTDVAIERKESFVGR